MCREDRTSTKEMLVERMGCTELGMLFKHKLSNSNATTAEGWAILLGIALSQNVPKTLSTSKTRCF
jgi:hypothetical protein